MALVEALLALAAKVGEEAAAVEAEVGMAQAETVVSLVEGTQVASKLCVVPQHRVAELVADEDVAAAAVVVAVVRN